MKKKTMKERLHETAYETAKDLHSVGAMDLATFQEFKKYKIVPVKKLSAREIKRIRVKEKLEQRTFAKWLNVSFYTLRAWEEGKQKPQGCALKLLNIVSKKGFSILIA